MSSAMTLALVALLWGCISAVSLPIGAFMGTWLKPPHKVTSSLMAFGGGALLFALTIELFAHSLHQSHEGHDKWIVSATIIGAILGGLIFESFNQFLSNRGAFLRKASLFKKYVHRKKEKKAQLMIQSLSKVRFLQLLPAESVAQLIPYVKIRRYSAGVTVFSQGDPGQELFFIVQGNVQVIRITDNTSKVIDELGEGDTFGEMALISDQPRSAAIRTIDDVEVYTLQKDDFEYFLKQSPQMQEASRNLMAERLHSISMKDNSFKKEARQWEEKALKNFSRLTLQVTSHDLEVEMKEQKGGSATAIWLGIALDGIPESLIIGMLVINAAAHNQNMSIAFIAGVFLANLPEAMSSAVTMRRQGINLKKIFFMWSSLCLMTGIGAMIGALIFPVDPQGLIRYFISGIEGLAAGAMLTMIANTMLPEAFEQGGSTISGLSTLAGFIVALCIKLFAQ
jgi:CRP-like cAMP-binding protein